MGFNKLGDSCEPYVEDGGLPADCQTEAMRALFVIGYAKLPDKWINKAEIYEIIETNAETEAFSWFFDLAEKGSKTRVGKDLRQFKERELDQIVLLIDDHADKSQQHRFQFTKRQSARLNVLGDLFGRLLPGSGYPNPDSTDSSNGHIGHFGHFVALPNTGENKWEENVKSTYNKKSVRSRRGEDVPNLPEVPKGRVITLVTDLQATAAFIQAGFPEQPPRRTWRTKRTS
jgi:hypothetical protein